MDGRRLGRTGLTVPALGLGTVKIGRNRDVKYPRAFDLPDDRAVAALLDTALEEGVVLWDTAPAYGTSEERLGPFVARARDRLVLCTKAGEEYGPAGSSYTFDAASLISSVHRSLRRLRTDRLDVLLLHSDGRDVAILDETDALEGLRRLKDAGDVLCIGISAKTAEGIDRACEDLDVVMAPVDATASALTASLRRAKTKGLGVLGIKVLGQGHGVSREGGLEAAFRTALVDGPADVAVTGTTNPDHLRQAAAVVRRLLGSGEADVS